MATTAQLGSSTIPDMAAKLTPKQERAVAEIDAAAGEYAAAKGAQETASVRSAAAALAALRLGVPPSVVERHSPFTGSYIRRLAREAGIKGDPKYDRTGKRRPETD